MRLRYVFLIVFGAYMLTLAALRLLLGWEGFWLLWMMWYYPLSETVDMFLNPTLSRLYIGALTMSYAVLAAGLATAFLGLLRKWMSYWGNAKARQRGNH